jgi:hypothetical protein
VRGPPLLERVARMSQTGRTLREQAHAMGFKTERYVQLRAQAKRAGLNVPEARVVCPAGQPAQRFAAVIAEMERSPPCPFDGLRGPHENCIATQRADDYIFRVSSLGIAVSPPAELQRSSQGRLAG